jgi:membrane-associated protease RseP (regulator of RpoE activity)
VWIGVGLSALVLALGAVVTARAGDEGKKHVDKKVVIFRSGGSWLGVQIADVDADRAKEIGMKDVRGAEVQSVSPGSPAEAAGVQEGDVITDYQGTRVEGVAQLTRLVHETPAGRTATLKVFRGGSSKELQVTMKGRDDEDLPGHMHVWSGDGDSDGDGNMHWMGVPAPPAPPGVDLEGLEDRLRGLSALGFSGGRPRLGIGVDSVGKQLGDYFGLKQSGGVLVTSVAKGSQGESAGLKAGDVIVKVDDEQVTDADDLHRAMHDRRDKALTLTIVRDRREQTIKVPQPPEPPEPPQAPNAPRAQRHAWNRDVQRDIERALEEARIAKSVALVDVQKSLEQSQKAYHDAMRQAADASGLTLEQQRKIQVEVERALERLRGLQGGHDGDVDVDEIDDTPAPSDDADEADDATPVSNTSASAPKASEEERAAIRRAVEEARRLRIGTQDADH